MALGAESGDVRQMVVSQGMKFALAGVVVGTAAAFGLAKTISALLFGVTAWDPVVFVSVPLLLCVIALVAVWLPAMRATRIDPVIALRYD
jgi:ABC-type antimicrobial peptide transport system permease subunit